MALAKLTVVGNKIVDQYGRERMLRGSNVMDWEWKYSWRATPEFELKAIPVLCGVPPNGWGANMIHFAVHSGPIIRNESKYLTGLDSIVTACTTADAYCLLAYRASDPDTGLPAQIDQAAATAMGILARRYVGNNTVLFGAGVEPHDVTWAVLKPQIERVIDAVRQQAPDAIVFCPGTNWSRYVHWAIATPIQRDNVVYRIDYYDPFSAVDTSYKLADVAAKYPVFIGEFGAGLIAGASTTLADMKLLLDYWEAHDIGWCPWNFNDEGQPKLLTSKTNFTVNAFGAEIMARLQAKYSDSHPGTPVSPPPPPPPPPPEPVPVGSKYKIIVGGMMFTIETNVPITIEGVTQ